MSHYLNYKSPLTERTACALHGRAIYVDHHLIIYVLDLNVEFMVSPFIENILERIRAIRLDLELY